MAAVAAVLFPRAVPVNAQPRQYKMEEACDKNDSYRVERVHRKSRFCLTEHGTGDNAHTGALAAFLRLYSGQSFLDEFPTLAVRSGVIEMKDIDHSRRALILRVWTNTRLRLNIPEQNVEEFVKVWFGKHGEFSQELNSLAALVAHAETLMDDQRRDITFSKQVSNLKRREYRRLLLNLGLLLRRGSSNTVCGYEKRHDRYAGF